MSSTTFEGTDSNGDKWSFITDTGLSEALRKFEVEREGKQPSKILVYYAAAFALLLPVADEMRPIHIYSTDFPYSVINDNYCVLLSKTPFTTTEDSSLEYTFYKAMISDEDITYDPTDIPVYNNITYTMCALINALAEINPRFSFNVSTDRPNTIDFTFTVDDYIPIITGTGIYNALTSEYMSDLAWYFEDLIDREITQTIVLNNYNEYDHVTFEDAKGDTISLNPIKYCPADGDYPETMEEMIFELSCPTGYSGSITRYCNDGAWEDEVDTCEEILPEYCPADGDWEQTATGQTAELSCSTGYTGSHTRLCNNDGTWQDAVDKCEKIESSNSNCLADGDWPATNSGDTSTLACPDGYTGSRTRECKDGTWQAVNDNCREVESSSSNSVCVAEDDWPETKYGETATIICESSEAQICSNNINVSAIYTRLCGDDGKWKDPVLKEDDDDTDTSSTNTTMYIIIAVVVFVVLIILIIKKKSNKKVVQQVAVPFMM